MPNRRTPTFLVAALLIPLLAAKASAAPGGLDFGFGTQGVALSSVGDDGVVAMTLQTDDKPLTATLADAGSDRATLRITRFTTGGVVDSTFGTAGVASVSVSVDTLSVVRAMLRQNSDNKLLVAGRSIRDFAVTRLTAAGGLDGGYGSGGTAKVSIAGDDEIFAIAQQTDGMIVAVGRADDGIDSDFAVVRLTTTGQPDPLFSGDGIATIEFGGKDTARAVAIQGDGAIVVAGVTEGSNSDIAVARLTSVGAPDGTFGVGGKVTTAVTPREDAAYAVIVQPADGKIVVAGEADDDFVLVRYSSTGQPDSGFGTSGIAKTNVTSGAFDGARALVRQSDNKLVAAGQANPAVAADFALVRYTTGGQPDAGFGVGGVVTTSVAATFAEKLTTLLLQSDGKLLAAGLSEDGLTSYQMIARYQAASGTCGNGNVENPEQCDDGNTVDTDACPTTCLDATCGDGFVRSGFEACDDGNLTPGDGCSATCTSEAICGDADQNGSISASDALRVLKNAVGLPVDCPLFVCDVDASGVVQAGDALKVLKKAVGQPLVLSCPAP